MKIFPDHVIPDMVQFFVQSKDRKRRSCGAGERMPVITKIYEQTADLLRRKVNPCLGKQTDYIGGGQLKGEMKGEGRLLTLDEFKAERTYFTPERKRAVSYLVLVLRQNSMLFEGYRLFQMY